MPAAPARRARAVLARRATMCCAVLACAAVAGCSLLGIRADVDEPTARRVLQEAVALARSPRIGQLCTLSEGGLRSEASSCPETLEDLAPLVPEDAPAVRCAVPVGDVGPLRGGVVLVLEGVDGQGDPYTTDFAVYDDGTGIGALDAVWWSGLTIRGYGSDTVTWRFDGGSDLCADGRLPPLDVPSGAPDAGG